MAEIGTQAVILQGAQRLFVWLTKFRKERLSRIMSMLIRNRDRPNEMLQVLRSEASVAPRLTRNGEQEIEQ